MKISKLLALVFVTLVVAILLASALNSFTRVTDSALADSAPTATPRTNAPAAKTPVKKYFLPIVLLNPTISTSWLLNGNSSTNYLTDFLGTTDNMTLTIRVSNTVAYRFAPVPFPSDAPNLIGGYSGNTVAPGVYGAMIGGGGGQFSGVNSINAHDATIAGGGWQ